MIMKVIMGRRTRTRKIVDRSHRSLFSTLFLSSFYSSIFFYLLKYNSNPSSKGLTCTSLIQIEKCFEILDTCILIN